MGKIDIKSMCLPELQSDFQKRELPKFRAKQVYGWLQAGVPSFEEMSNIPKTLREALTADYFIPGCQIERKQVSALDGTVKYLFRLYDNELIEAVVMKYHHGNSICISSQVGCKMGCTFCATGMAGFTRNLLPAEMLSQIHTAQADVGERISNIVLMGMGEPLDNYDNVLKFLRLVTEEGGLNIGYRHISLSTCGIADHIYRLAEEKLQLTLSVSLHAPNDAIRSRTMPVNRKWNMESLLKACKYYSDLTGRRISFEYAMIDGVNDSDQCAHELARRIRGILCHVNLIPVNNVTGAGYRKSSQKTLRRFSDILESHGFTVTVRRTLGSDIEASCGQLRGKALAGEQQEKPTTVITAEGKKTDESIL